MLLGIRMPDRSRAPDATWATCPPALLVCLGKERDRSGVAGKDHNTLTITDALQSLLDIIRVWAEDNVEALPEHQLSESPHECRVGSIDYLVRGEAGDLEKDVELSTRREPGHDPTTRHPSAMDRCLPVRRCSVQDQDVIVAGVSVV